MSVCGERRTEIPDSCQDSPDGRGAGISVMVGSGLGIELRVLRYLPAETARTCKCISREIRKAGRERFR